MSDAKDWADECAVEINKRLGDGFEPLTGAAVKAGEVPLALPCHSLCFACYHAGLARGAPRWTKLDHDDETTWPGEGREVLVRHVPDGLMCARRDEHGWYAEHGTLATLRLTHWMPLPEVPT